MRWARLVLTLSLIVGWTSAAAAECAWVLWKKDLERPKDWEVLAAFESRRECIDNGRWFVARVQTLMDQVYAKKPPQPPMTISVEKHKGGYTMNMNLTQEGLVVPYLDFVCFPDTIDPREKKE